MVFGRYDIATFASFFAYAAGAVVIPVALVEVARELGFPLASGGMTAGGALHLGRTVPMVAALLGCGFAAGRWGKRRAFGWSVLLMGLGMAGCAVAPVYAVLFLALMLAGIGEGIVEGLATPFVQDLHLDEPGRYINFSHGFWSVGVLVTVLVSGALLSLGVSWRLLTGAVAAVSLIPAWLLLRPSRHGPPYPEHPEPIHWTTVHDHAVRILRRPHFWLFFAAMFVAGGGEFCLTFWCASYIRLNFTDAAWAGGLGTALFSAGMVAGRTGWGYLIKQHQLRHLVLLSALAGTVISLLFPVLTNLGLFFGLLFLVGIATAPLWPSVQSYCADRLPGTDTTMLFVLLAAAGIPGCGFFTWLMGVIGDRGGLRHAFYLVPACFLALAALMGLDRLWPRRQVSNAAPGAPSLMPR
jgi:MFS family permease